MWRSKVLLQQLARQSLSSARRLATGPTAAASLVAVGCGTALLFFAEQQSPNHGERRTTTALCEGLLLPPSPSGRLRRYSTIERLKETAADDRLERLYDISWKEPLGKGAFGSVYLGTHRETVTQVAIKKIPKTLTNNAAFQREMDVLLKIKEFGGHSSICLMREHFDQGPHFYLIFDLVQGGELFDHLCEHGAYSEADAARLFRGVASALAFLHGIGIIHCDLKPENVMLSSEQDEQASVKLVDFGCAHITSNAPHLDHEHVGTGLTPAYAPPEFLNHRRFARNHADLQPSFDMWSLGVLLYTMLTGTHPFDLECELTNDEIEAAILAREKPPIRNSIYTEHLSQDAIELLEGLIEWDPEKRLTAEQLLENRWVRGETASSKKIQGSDRRLAAYRRHLTEVGKNVFKGLLDQSDKHGGSEVAKRTSILEMAFHDLDSEKRGYISVKGDNNARFSLSDMTDLLSENMKSRYLSKGKEIYKEGQQGDHMFFIQTGQVEVTSADGFRTVRQAGEFFGEDALVHKDKKHKHTVQCSAPVHLLEISREYFDKYIKADVDVELTMKETDRLRQRERAKVIIGLQKNMEVKKFDKGDLIFREGDMGHRLYILESGNVDISVGGHVLRRGLRKGEMTGEHAAFYKHKAYNVTAQCASEECTLHALEGKHIQDLCRRNTVVRDSFRDFILRRDFKKALVSASKRPFPQGEKDLRTAFNEIDSDQSGELHFDNLCKLVRQWDPTYDDKDIRDMLKSHDLNLSESITWDEFKSIFGMVNES